MSRSTLNVLPEPILTELLNRYFNFSHLTIDDHLSWIKDQGHLVSRSSLHRYLTTHKETASKVELERNAAIKAEEVVRLKCLEIAASFYKGDDQSELLGLAEDILGWIQTTDASR